MPSKRRAGEGTTRNGEHSTGAQPTGAQHHLRGARDHRPALRQPAARASASVQKYRSPREVLIRVRS